MFRDEEKDGAGRRSKKKKLDILLCALSSLRMAVSSDVATSDTLTRWEESTGSVWKRALRNKTPQAISTFGNDLVLKDINLFCFLMAYSFFLESDKYAD